MLTEDELSRLKDILYQATTSRVWEIRTDVNEGNHIDIATIFQAITKLVAEVDRLRDTTKKAQRLVEIWRARAEDIEKSGFSLWDDGFYGTLKGEGRFETLQSCANELEEVLNQNSDVPFLKQGA